MSMTNLYGRDSYLSYFKEFTDAYLFATVRMEWRFSFSTQSGVSVSVSVEFTYSSIHSTLVSPIDLDWSDEKAKSFVSEFYPPLSLLDDRIQQQHIFSHHHRSLLDDLVWLNTNSYSHQVQTM
ncbi:hypothetical protein BLOT_010608 [Blomia tropicalis]|nr:hypothetical protein BLOT_010608 [Blomia tropicalis]